MSAHKGIATLCLVIALAVAVVAAIGVFGRGGMETETVTSVRGETYEMITDGIYAFNSERMVAEGVGWDIFTLFLAVPALLAVVPAVWRGSLRGRLIAIGLLAYFFYQYLMYAMAWAVGPLFVPWIGIYAASMAGIVWTVSTIDVAGLPGAFTERFPARGMAVFSCVMGILLIGMWAQRINIVLSGNLNDSMLYGQTTLVVQALDLGLVVPLALFTAVTAWLRRPTGYLLASVLVVKAIAMSGAITAMLVGAWIVEGNPDVVGLAIFVTAALGSLLLAGRMSASVRPAPTMG